jgi:hypothetical protein
VLNPRVLLVDRTASALVYLHDGANGEDYDACVQINWEGETAHLHSLTGSGFYLAYDKFMDLLRARGIRFVEAEVREPHAKLIEKLAERSGCKLERLSHTTVVGVDLVKIRLTL